VGTERIFLVAEWRYLAMLNYEVDPGLLRPLVPAGTELDCWSGKVFLSLIGFRFLKTRLFGRLPIPFHSNFDEVNLRFYVRRQEGNELRRGVAFIREIVPRRAIAFVARSFYNENYVALPMRHEIDFRDTGLEVAYSCRSTRGWCALRVSVEGDAGDLRAGSEEQFITEHGWGYSAQRDGGTVEYRVAHPAWRVWRARHPEFSGELTGLYGKEFACVLSGMPTSALLAEGSEVTVSRGRRL